MYNAQTVINNINDALKLRKVSKAKMCEDLGISKNTINSMTDKKGISSFDLARIADYLRVTVDSLLGRDPEENGNAPIVTDRSELAAALSKLSPSDTALMTDLAAALAAKSRSQPPPGDQ